MATKNLVDDTSTTVSAATPGVQLDLRYRTTLSRSALGVPVRMWVYASSTVANDTGAVQILDSSASPKLTVPITGTTAQWYATDGYLPATDAKYDAVYGGNTLGSLSVYAFSIYEYADISPNEGALSASIGAFTLSATGTAAASFSTDATSGKGVPASAAEWTAARASAGLSGTAAHLWLMQEGSSNLTDTIGGVTLTAGGGPDYAQTVSGWSRAFLGEKDNSPSVAVFSSASASLPDPSTTSQMLLVYTTLTATPGSETEVCAVGGAGNVSYVTATTGPVYKGYLSGGGGSTAGASNPGTAVRPLIIQMDRANSVYRVITDQEVIEPSWSTPAASTKRVSFGSEVFGLAAPSLFGYAALFTGTAAELTRTQIKTLLTTLGWSVAWTP